MVICPFNNLTILDVSDNVNLATLICTNNQISSLDLSNNTLAQLPDEITNLSILKLGDKVNIEFDPLARYIHGKYGK